MSWPGAVAWRRWDPAAGGSSHVTGAGGVDRGGLVTWSDDVEASLLEGEHALLVAGDLRASREWFDAAYRKAERRGDKQGMARAALGLGGLWLHEHRGAADAAMVRARQRHALASVGPDSSLGLRLRIRLAAEEDYRAGAHAKVLDLVTEARRSGDAVVLAEALSLAHHCVLGPEHGELRLELSRELIGLASRTGRRSDLLVGLLWHAVDSFLRADPHAERHLVELRGLLATEDHLAVGFVVDAMEVMRGIRDGRFDQAEAAAKSCADRGTTAGDIDAAGWYGGQMAAIRWYQGRIAELVPMVSQLMTSPMLSAVDNSYFAILAVAAVTAGDRRLAMGALARLRGRGLAGLTHSSSWLVSMYAVVEAAYLLEDAELSAEAYGLLRPFAHLPAIASLGVACLGSVQHCLGVASLTLGEVDRAAEHLRAAVQDNLGLGHWPAAALSRARLGQALTLRAGPRDEAALRELSLAAQEAAALGMALSAAATAASASRAGRDISARDEGPVTCRRHGRQWRLELGDRTAYLEHSVGMNHLSILLANPGQEISAIELAAGPGLRGRAPSQDAATAQPVLDEQAKRGYKQRLTELQAEIDELESMNESERATALHAERDWLLDELAAATGLGDRTRLFTGNEERARLAVGKAIRRALTRIAAADPVIGAELRATVQTGIRCCYRPG